MDKTDDKIIEITRDVKWIGVLDYDIRTFDIVMHTDMGTTYNSYFINAEKKAVVEIAKEKFSDVYIRKLRAVTDPKDIKYIIVDHTEPDHSGSLGLLLDIAPEATVVGSGNAIRYLEDIVNKPFRSLVVKDGDTLDLGNKTIRFVSAPNLHWPDSAMSYLVEDKILFTCDVFGAHYCTPELFSEFSPKYIESFRYYFEIIMRPFSKFMLKAIEKVRSLDVDFVCPGHGPVHKKENIDKALELCEKYSRQYLETINEKSRNNILIAYVSAYGYTKEAANIVAEGILETKGITVDVTDIESINPGDLEAKIMMSDGILVGSPTINQNTLLPVYTMFALINPIRDKGKLAGAFGSYGWSGEATKIILENLRSLKLTVVDNPAAFKFAPGSSKKEQLKEFGRQFGQKFIHKLSEK